ncbi:ATPase, T2SS/T4P/T4SS family [Bordetella holmesii]|uniref:Type II/IV secretion system domain protein n=2 Tax=Bordetella holmesii TaxID=35814 RepID=A0A158M4E1_9BORD|nr:ATPase, T2SS/T4P/T4SS family [Bordetella holmesii]AHV94853.1 type II/IV secretion system family protein [Bordetella holmesii ATCC 51541]AIT25384.1 type II/IV secretion system family protein [Bordetella holmesii 44057]EWM45947.1 type II/IV secretion system family protein [Bordetella holmesii 70147]EWM48572.1 type II/IV secretion system family protein [Bordetella holmesii 41130]EWM50080.1 type II/IV secretion system family protein [Bordetella holmesii 35009]
MNEAVVSLHAVAQLQPPLKRVLDAELELGGLRGHICPVLLANGQVAVLAQARYVRGAWMNEILRQLDDKGYSLARPVCYQVDAALLLDLLRPFRAPSALPLAPRESVPPGGRPTLALLFEDIVRAGLGAGASDIHLNVLGQDRAEVRYSIDGRYVSLPEVRALTRATTLATLLRGLSRTRKIITLEDPVEIRITDALQNTVGRGLDADHDGVFDAKLKTIKRSAMNDVYLGEVRDRETGRAFMDLAGSGVSVYTTVHAGSAQGIPARLSSDFIGIPADFLQMRGVLKLLVY